MAEHRFPPPGRSATVCLVTGLLSGGLLLACAFMPLGARSAGNGSSTTPAEHVVTMEGMHFEPETLTVKPGDRVTWVNKDLVPHTATAASGTFNSQAIAADASWTYTAGAPGNYSYACLFHPTMHATLIVQ